MTGTDRAVMVREAERLAAAYWEAREQFAFGPVTVPLAECLALANASLTHPVILADSGDNPTGGGVGDRADVLAAFLEAGRGRALFAGIADRPATEAAYRAGIGARLWLSIGATLDPSSQPVDVEATVVALLDTAEPLLREAVVAIGNASVILTARRRPFTISRTSPASASTRAISISSSSSPAISRPTLRRSPIRT